MAEVVALRLVEVVEDPLVEAEVVGVVGVGNYPLVLLDSLSSISTASREM